MMWIGGLLALLGLVWAVLPHTMHASVVSSVTGVAYELVIENSHAVHRGEGVVSFVIGVALFWFGRK